MPARPLARLDVWLPLLVAAVAGLLATLALAQLARGLVTLLTPAEVMYGESIIHDQAARLLRGEALYQPRDGPPYTVAAYTPAYYLLAAGLQRISGPGFLPGRMLSVLAGLVATGLVAHLAGRLTGQRAAGLVAALMFLGLGVPGLYPWLALYKEDVLALTFSLSAIAILAGETSRQRCVLAAVFTALALLTKQTHLAPFVAGAIWLWRQDRANAVSFAAVAGGLVVAVSVYLELATGAYLANTVFANVNPFHWGVLLENLRVLGLHQGVPLIVAGAYMLRCQPSAKQPLDRLLCWFWAASMLPLVGLAKVGSNHNYWLELAAVTAVLATAGVWDLLIRWREGHDVQAGLSWARLTPAALLPVILASLLMAAELPTMTAGYRPPIDQAVHRVRAEPNQVLAVPLDVITLAERPVLLEPYLYSILQRQGLWDAGPLISRICAGEIGLVVVDRALDQTGHSFHGYNHWPEPVLAALRDTMTLESAQGDRLLYVPVPQDQRLAQQSCKGPE